MESNLVPSQEIMALTKNLKLELIKILHTFRLSVIKFVESPSAEKLHCYKQRDLSCACGITVHALASLLERKGLAPSIVLGVYIEKGTTLEKITPEHVNHCWIELENHIIDLTLTQFKNEKKEIVLRPTKSSGKRFIPIVKTSVKKMKQDIIDWPKEQIPSLRNTKHILRNYQLLSGENLGV